MGCPICGNAGAIEHPTFAGGLRFDCPPCGGYFCISSTLETLAEGKEFDIGRTRAVLEAKRERKRQEPLDPNRPQDLEPTLTSDDQELLIHPD